jgi:hypothetical protein
LFPDSLLFSFFVASDLLSALAACFTSDLVLPDTEPDLSLGAELLGADSIRLAGLFGVDTELPSFLPAFICSDLFEGGVCLRTSILLFSLVRF